MFAIYKENDSMALVVPPKGFDHVQAAEMAIPFKHPFLFVPEKDIPEDLDTLGAWDADFSEPDGYGLGPQRYFIRKALREISAGERIEDNEKLIAQMTAEIEQAENIQFDRVAFAKEYP